MQRLYSLRDVWETLGIKMRTLRDWVRRGKLHAIKMPDRHWYITEKQYVVLKERTGDADKNRKYSE